MPVQTEDPTLIPAWNAFERALFDQLAVDLEGAERSYFLMGPLKLPPSGNGRELDGLVVGQKCVFVMEAKNWKGHLRRELNTPFEQLDPSRAGSHNARHEDPVGQADAHWKSLKTVLEREFGLSLFIKSVLVFPNETRLELHPEFERCDTRSTQPAILHLDDVATYIVEFEKRLTKPGGLPAEEFGRLAEALRRGRTGVSFSGASAWPDDRTMGRDLRDASILEPRRPQPSALAAYACPECGQSDRASRLAVGAPAGVQAPVLPTRSFPRRHLLALFFCGTLTLMAVWAYQSWLIQTSALLMGFAAVTALFYGLLSLRPVLSLVRYLRDRQRIGAWAQAQRRWNDLYYCARDDMAYMPGTDIRLKRSSIQRYLWSR